MTPPQPSHYGPSSPPVHYPASPAPLYGYTPAPQHYAPVPQHGPHAPAPHKYGYSPAPPAYGYQPQPTPYPHQARDELGSCWFKSQKILELLKVPQLGKKRINKIINVPCQGVYSRRKLCIRVACWTHQKLYHQKRLNTMGVWKRNSFKIMLPFTNN